VQGRKGCIEHRIVLANVFGHGLALRNFGAWSPWNKLLAQCRLVFLRDLCRVAFSPTSIAIRGILAPDFGCPRRGFRQIDPKNLPRSMFCKSRARKPSGIELLACDKPELVPLVLRVAWGIWQFDQHGPEVIDLYGQKFEKL